jgi:hypothetical protein
MGRSGHEVSGGRGAKNKARGSNQTGSGLTTAQKKLLKTEYKKAAAAMSGGVSTAWGRGAVRGVRRQATERRTHNARSPGAHAARYLHLGYAVGAFAACFLFVIGLKPPARLVPATIEAAVGEPVNGSAEPVRVAISVDTIPAERAPLVAASSSQSPGTQAASEGWNGHHSSAPLDIRPGLAMAAHGENSDVPPTLETKYPTTFAGVWGPDPSACSARNTRGYLPTVIDADGARAGETFCRFTSKKPVADGWDVVASCSNQRERWTSNVRLRLEGERLSWTSKRGSQAYVRCTPNVIMAEAVMR